MTVIRYVTVGCNANPDYAFYLPIINRIWTELGFKMIPLLVGDKSSWSNPWQSLVISKLSNIVWLESKGYNQGTLAQVARLFAFEHINTNDTLMLSDVDLIPLSRTWFNQSQPDKLNLYFANAYNHSKYPMCYVDAPKDIWQEIMTEPMDEAMNRANHWGWDEEYMGYKIQAWSGYKNKCKCKCNFINRIHLPKAPCPERRLDRNCWDFNGEIGNLIDCHGFRPCYDGQEWILTNILLRRLNIEYGYITDYREKFIKLIDKEKDYERVR